MKKIVSQLLLQNWKSGLTVSLISIPLSLALAIASGATPTQGIITAFWAGLFGAFLGSSHYNIIGPTGALSGILITFTLAYSFSMLPLIALLSGLIIFLCYIFHLDKYIIFIPKSVVHGFTVGVAFIIAFGQIDNILGLSGIIKTDSLIQNTWNSLKHLSDTNLLVFGIFILTTAFIWLWDKKIKRFPGSIIATLLGIVFVIYLEKTNVAFQITTLETQYQNINATLYDNIWSNWQKNIFFNKDLWVISLATALVAILETLLSGQIAQDITKINFNRSREVLGLSMANIASGLMGGIPATAALARTSLNIKSGANHRSSGIMSAVFLAIITLFFFSFFKLLPVVIIAAILFVLALRMIETKHFIKLIENEKISFFLSLSVAIITIAEDPIVGLVVGTFIALLIFVNKISYGQTEIILWKNGEIENSFLKTEIIKKDFLTSELVIYKISGTLTYINMPAHLDAIRKIVNNKHVIISLRHAFYADLDGIEYLKELIAILKKNNEKVYLSGINSEIYKLIKKEDFYKQKLIERKIFKRSSEAIKEIYEK